MDRNNLLTDPIFRVSTSGRQIRAVCLPALLAALARDEVDCLPGLLSHQEDIFHIFLCYLAGAVLAREGESSLVQGEEFWRQSLVRLSGGAGDTAWSILVEDRGSPGFMQSPLVTNGQRMTKLEPKAWTPDELDILQTAKNHDVKSRRAAAAEPEDWAYALVSLQTAGGFLGQGNYGIARMNGGFGSRPCVGLVYSASPGGRFRRDVERLSGLRLKLLSDPWPYRSDGLVFTWIEPWDGKQQISLGELDPFFLETARIVRLSRVNGQVVAFGQATKASRIHCSDLKGVLGDPWTPIKSAGKGNASSLTLSETGFKPQLLRDLLFEDGYEAAEMQRPDSGRDGAECIFHASALVRGQGVTEGYHVVDLPIPGRVAANLFAKAPGRKVLEELSKTGIDDAAKMQNRVLGVSLFALLEGGPDSVNFDKREVSQWVAKAKGRFSDAWADSFFPWLWTTVEASDQVAARVEWLQRLSVMARDAFHQSLNSMPVRTGRAYRARARAESVFYGALYHNFPELKGIYDQ